MLKKKIILLSFATPDLKKSIERLRMQAVQSQYYDQINIMGPSDLNKEVKKKINLLLYKGKKRGYCYWFWKPLL